MSKDQGRVNRAMEQNNRRASRHYALQRRMLLRGRIPAAGLLEKLALERQGRIDGEGDLIRADGDGEWSSSFINREKSRYNEYCDKVWGLLQIDNVELLCRIGVLLDDMDECRAKIRELDAKISEIREGHKTETAERKRGEEALSEGQIKARRRRECERMIAPLSGKREALEERISRDFEEADQLLNRMRENTNGARLVCERVKQHTRQRMDIYWHAAMTVSPSSKDMPVKPAEDLSSEAEETYLRTHCPLISAAEGRLHLIESELREAAGEKEQILQ